MAEGVVSNLASKAIEKLAILAFREAATWWGARDELTKLEDTIEMIRARVNDAEKRHEDVDSEMIKKWLVRLKHALYRAEDLVDEVLTDDRLKQHTEMSKFQKLSIFFSRSGSLYCSIKLAHRIKSIRKELNAIKLDMDSLRLNISVVADTQLLPILKNRETASFILTHEIIGRENDKKKIIEMLFEPNYVKGCSVSVITVVGLAGVGKTTLAQMVFNDKNVRDHFELSKWACVPEVNDHKEILGKVFNAFTGKMYHGLTLEELKSGIKDLIEKKQYLLVLDDVWDEDRDQWLMLMSLLQCCGCGSKIIVTTRSQGVAEVVGDNSKDYKLGLLSDDESWKLFRSLAYKRGQEDCDPLLIEIGKDIVKKCGNVPLAIRVVGNTLYNKSTEKEWQMFRNAQYSKPKLTHCNTFIPELKLSYDFLTPGLKQCFAYCALFPKDHKFSKDELVHLWMAQGYLEPWNEVFSPEEVGHLYFFELLRRNFFQDAEEDCSLNDNIYCKMHDLVHDLAQYVSGDEIITVDMNRTTIQCTTKATRVMHVSLSLTTEDIWDEFVQVIPSTIAARKLRSLLFRVHDVEVSHFKCENLVFHGLRALDMKYMGIETVPDSIGELKHLRYLNLAGNYIRCLPDAITGLVNLQTLNLDECRTLEELPRDFTKLENLRHLSLKECLITEMPLKFEEMKSLRELSHFVVGKNAGIDALPALHLRGELTIEFRQWRTDVVNEATNAILKSNKHLTHLSLHFRFADVVTFVVSAANMDEFLHCLELPRYVRFLSVLDFEGERFPRRMLNGFSKLVVVSFQSCCSTRVLPIFSQLPHLKFLDLQFLSALEFIEDYVDNSDCHGDFANYFPSLVSLQLNHMDELKGWSRADSSDMCSKQHRSFPSLSELSFKSCPKLMSMPSSPKLRKLLVSEIDAELLKFLLSSHDQDDEEGSSSFSSAISTSLKRLTIDNVSDLENLTFASSKLVEYLEICNCRSLRNISEGLQHLSKLEALRILSCEELDLWDDNHMNEDDEEKRGQPLRIRTWQGLRALRSLYLYSISKLEVLPCGIGCVTTLQSLTIKDLVNLTALPEQFGNLSQLQHLFIGNCRKLASLPQSFCNLSSLQQLQILNCPVLEKRCRPPNGEDWPLIRHIPNL